MASGIIHTNGAPDYTGNYTVTTNGNIPISGKKATQDITVNVDTRLPEEVKAVELAMSSGNQIVTPSQGKVMTQVTVNKPIALVAENIKSGVNIGGVIGNVEVPINYTGSYNITANGNIPIANKKATQDITVNVVGGKPEEVKIVDLAMASGNQVITPTVGKVISQLTVNKPPTMLPENIKSGVNIGGIVGSLAAGGGNSNENASLDTSGVSISANYNEVGVHILGNKLNFSYYLIYLDNVLKQHGVNPHTAGGESFYLPTGDTYYSVSVVVILCTDTMGYASKEQRVSAQPCLAKGTKVQLAKDKTKNIEDVTYNDDLLVWNFDDGKFDSAKPLWIKIPQISPEYNLLKFSDGTELKTINQHRIFNKEQGKFAYPMSDETPIGTTTFNASGQAVTLVSKEVIRENVEYYNIITDRHINCFTNTILTSCRLNNIYPIKDMKFIKDNRKMRPITEFPTVEENYYNGLRLGEQIEEVSTIGNVENMSLVAYVDRLKKIQKALECKV